MSALDAALASGDLDAFDRAVEELGGARELLAALLDRAPREERALVERMLPRDVEGTLDVSALAAHGPVAFWCASEWILRVVPGGETRAPLPVHEQWDALLEIHRARPEAAWIVVELLTSLSTDQRALAHRITLGLARRFGDRGQRILTGDRIYPRNHLR